MKIAQSNLFGPDYERASRMLPIIGEQKDIRYFAAPAKSVLNGPETTGMGFWSVNPYVGCAFGCAYCYARYAHRYVMERATSAERLDAQLRSELSAVPPWLAFERNVFVKTNAAEVLRRTLRQGSDKHLGLIEGDAIVIGTATDPYQPAERRFRVTRGILETLAEHPGLRIVIITKSALITRDIDVLSRIARRSTLTVHVSLISVRRDLARRIEPRAPTPEARLRAIARLAEAGIDVGVNCMPVLPGITDNPTDLEDVVKAVAKAGASHIGFCALRLQSAARQRYLPFIDQEFPQLSERYRNTYAHAHQPGERYREGLARFAEQICQRYSLGTWRRSEEDDADESEDSLVGERMDEQLSLAFVAGSA